MTDKKEAKPRKRVNSKGKGSGFERQISNTLSERFEPLLGIKQGFRRNPDSGSFFGGSNVKRVETHDQDFAVFGDLICPRNFKWSIECKNYKDAPSLNLIINQNVKSWDDWLVQMEGDAAKGNKLGVLIVKYNNTSIFVMIKKTATLGLSNTPILIYGDHHMYSFDDFLKMGDSFFFDIK